MSGWLNMFFYFWFLSSRTQYLCQHLRHEQIPIWCPGDVLLGFVGVFQEAKCSEHCADKGVELKDAATCRTDRFSVCIYEATGKDYCYVATVFAEPSLAYFNQQADIYNNAYNAKDWDKLKTLYTEDATFIAGGSPPAKGHQGLCKSSIRCIARMYCFFALVSFLFAQSTQKVAIRCMGRWHVTMRTSLASEKERRLILFKSGCVPSRTGGNRSTKLVTFVKKNHRSVCSSGIISLATGIYEASGDHVLFHSFHDYVISGDIACCRGSFTMTNSDKKVTSEGK